MALIGSPEKTEWDTSAISARGRAYLDDDLSFEEIAARVIESATVISNRIEPYLRPRPRGEEWATDRIFIIRVSCKPVT